MNDRSNAWLDSTVAQKETRNALRVSTQNPAPFTGPPMSWPWSKHRNDWSFIFYTLFQFFVHFKFCFYVWKTSPMILNTDETTYKVLNCNFLIVTCTVL